MAYNIDWLPGARTAILAMVMKCQVYMTGERRTLWGIPSAEYTALGATLEEAASEKHYLMKPSRDGKGLTHLRFTRRKKEKILFDSEDSGKTVYVCCCYENRKGEVGQWGPVASSVIPWGSTDLFNRE
jgi:hypothetical protein